MANIVVRLQIYIKRGKLTTLSAITHRHTVSCSYHSPIAPTVRQCLAVTIPCSSHTHKVSCIYHSLTAPILKECLAFTIPLQLPYSKSVLQLLFPYSSHIQRVSWSYHSPYSSHTQRVSCSYFSLTTPTLESVLQLPYPCSSHTQRVYCSYHSLTAPTLGEYLAVIIRLQYSQSDLLLPLTLSFIIRRQSDSLLYWTLSFSTRHQPRVGINSSSFWHSARQHFAGTIRISYSSSDRQSPLIVHFKHTEFDCGFQWPQLIEPE